jgi:hypothetical protein
VSSPASRWNEVCERLGVKPKQFAVLVGATAIAVGALGTKSIINSKRTPRARPAAATDAAPQDPQADGVDGPQPGGTWSTGGGPRTATVRCELQVRPARDPFKPFFLVQESASAESGSGAAPGSPSSPTAAAPAGLSLRAVIAGEYAVVGEDTVGVGGTAVDADGVSWTVEEIHERHVIVSDGARRAQLGYGQARAASKGARK